MSNAASTVEKAIELFAVLTPQEMPGIDSLRYGAQMPEDVAQRLYHRIENCPELELYTIQQAVVKSSLISHALLTAYLDNIDVALEIVRAQVANIHNDAAYATALRDLIDSFQKLGMDELPDYDFKKSYSDLHAARLIASGVNVTSSNFVIPHDYHVALEMLRGDMEFLRTAVTDFYQVKFAFRYMTPLTELLEAVHYVHERKGDDMVRIVDMVTERGGFDRELFDMILDAKAPAVSSGVI